jgi:hypothetical protein
LQPLNWENGVYRGSDGMSGRGFVDDWFECTERVSCNQGLTGWGFDDDWFEGLGFTGWGFGYDWFECLITTGSGDTQDTLTLLKSQLNLRTRVGNIREPHQTLDQCFLGSTWMERCDHSPPTWADYIPVPPSTVKEEDTNVSTPLVVCEGGTTT